MPPSETARGKPALDAIAFALTKMAQHFTPDKSERVPDFRYLLGRVSERYPARQWDRDFVRMSDQCKWPEWTDVALPNLCDALGDNKFLFWWAIFQVLSRIVILKVKQQLCDGRVFEVVVPQRNARRIERIASPIEHYRRTASDGGNRAEIGILSSALEELKALSSHRGDRDTERAVGEVHAAYVMGRLPAAA